MRPEQYQYSKNLENHLALKKGIYPRQLEIQLPGNHLRNCNFNCYYCSGKRLQRGMDNYEMTALKLIDNLKGKIPYIIYAGNYTEPTLNPYFMALLAMTKKHGSNFGIHTNGSLLKNWQKNYGFLTELCRISTSKEDYLSISLDAGKSGSHAKIKNVSPNCFDNIIEGIKMAIEARGDKDFPSIRICYLLTDENSSDEELENIVKITKDLKVDSLRFSIPYKPFASPFEEVREWKNSVESKKYNIEKFLGEKVFYIPPEFQDVDKMDFKHCSVGFYQITIGADGYVYKCSTTAAPNFPKNRLGKVTDNVEKFKKMIIKNQSKKWNPETCFKCGGRCNRMSLEVNKKYDGI